MRTCLLPSSQGLPSCYLQHSNELMLFLERDKFRTIINVTFCHFWLIHCDTLHGAGILRTALPMICWTRPAPAALARRFVPITASTLRSSREWWEHFSCTGSREIIINILFHSFYTFLHSTYTWFYQMRSGGLQLLLNTIWKSVTLWEGPSLQSLII